MKKLLALLLALAMLLMLAAGCSVKSEKDTASTEKPGTLSEKTDEKKDAGKDKETPAHEITLGGKTFMSDVEDLNLSGCDIEDISALAGLKNLEELDVYDNPIEDYSPVEFVPNLGK